MKVKFLKQNYAHSLYLSLHNNQRFCEITVFCTECRPPSIKLLWLWELLRGFEQTLTKTKRGQRIINPDSSHLFPELQGAVTKAEMPTPCSEEGGRKEEPRVDQGWLLNDNNKSEPRDFLKVVLARWLTSRNWNKCIIIWKDNFVGESKENKVVMYVCSCKTYKFSYAFCKMRSNCQHLLDHRESKGMPEKKNLLLLSGLH